MKITTYKCHLCSSAELAAVACNPALINLTGSVYLMDKYRKHDVDVPLQGVTSSFGNQGYNAYNNHVINTVHSGSAQYVNGALNAIIFVVGETVGWRFRNGVPEAPENAIKLVHPLNDQRIHAYSTESLDVAVSICVCCGNPVLA